MRAVAAGEVGLADGISSVGNRVGVLVTCNPAVVIGVCDAGTCAVAVAEVLLQPESAAIRRNNPATALKMTIREERCSKFKKRALSMAFRK